MSKSIKPFKFPVSILVGSTVANIIQVTKGYRLDRRYYPKMILTFIVATFFEILNLAERLLYKNKIKKTVQEQPPVFIIGFWRSGTTLLHSLLCQDTQAGYVTTFQGVFPNVVLSQKKWMKAFANWALPKKRPFDSYPMDMDFPQEEDFAMMSLQPKSIYKMFYFPKDFNDIYEKELYFEKWSVKHRNNWRNHYQTLIKKAMLNTGGKRYMSKNPCNIFRIKALIELYPNAKFIFIYRNPYTVVNSLCRFVNEVLPGSELQHLEGGLTIECFARLYKDSLDEYLKMKETIAADNLVEIKYEEFKNHPIEKLREIYKQFNISGFGEASPRMESYLENNHPSGRKPYEIDHEVYQLVNKYAKDIVIKLGYQVIESPE